MLVVDEKKPEIRHAGAKFFEKLKSSQGMSFFSEIVQSKKSAFEKMLGGF